MDSPAERIEGLFPALRGMDWRITSPFDTRYNCIAWAAGDITQWWWPRDPTEGYYWPAGIDFAQTLTAFVAALALLAALALACASPRADCTSNLAANAPAHALSLGAGDLSFAVVGDFEPSEILPILGKLERPLPLPESISRPVIGGGGPMPSGATAKPMEKA